MRKLNEGITVYKQEMYDKFLGNNTYTGGYRIERDVAKFIADVIGKEQLVSMHFNNDYGAIRTAFNEKTGKELNELVNELNKKSTIKTMLFGKKYTRYFAKKMQKCIENIGWEKEKKAKTDFVPKFKPDYTIVGKHIKEYECEQKQQDTRNSDFYSK